MTALHIIHYINCPNAPVAQLVEHLTLNQGVQGSNPCGCTKNLGDGGKYRSIIHFLALNLLHIYYTLLFYLLH